ncbi:ParD-like family protein [Parathalassolituus penaei]|uniref:ParD-like family protein n=1 Tax=Parathalassolituus penaei TaxID=2997323 RepID=A0A9X3EGK4_9GAMM|nr:ParD-like family protein [Parathalassolituus penaei]MCY0966810.1 ParD-like family protein [Parathalassolituus penaei]
MGIIRISDELHDDLRKASTTMLRSINAQAEFWIRIGMLAESNPDKTYQQLIREQLKLADLQDQASKEGMVSNG